MKKRVLVFFLLCMIFCGVSRAQDNLIKVNVFSPFVRTLNVSYERVVAENMSYQAGLFLTGYHLGDTRYRGFGITPEVRFYMQDAKDAPEGFYLAPFLRYTQIRITEETEVFGDVPGTAQTSGILTGFGGGAVAGYQIVVLRDMFTLDGFIGPMFMGGSLSSEERSPGGEITTGPFEGFNLRFGISAGVMF